MFERKQVASEWDMGWFCYKCEKLSSWKTKAYVSTTSGHYYCAECANRIKKSREKK